MTIVEYIVVFLVATAILTVVIEAIFGEKDGDDE